ncbi:MAG: hypothetical protein ACYS6I_02700 [Planctomycetota bacterium]|jgi:hypothetical protein
MDAQETEEERQWAAEGGEKQVGLFGATDGGGVCVNSNSFELLVEMR